MEAPEWKLDAGRFRRSLKDIQIIIGAVGRMTDAALRFRASTTGFLWSGMCLTTVDVIM
jgi:hypothetical protein